MELMETASIGLLDRTLCAGIKGYQRYLSPYKGFCCAYRVCHGGESCSQFVRNSILQYGAFAAYGVSRRRLRDCKQAAAILREQSGLPKRTVWRRTPRRPRPSACGPGDCGGPVADFCACEMLDCGSTMACDACSVGACDLFGGGCGIF